MSILMTPLAFRVLGDAEIYAMAIVVQVLTRFLREPLDEDDVSSK